jgi:phage tail-like protein
MADNAAGSNKPVQPEPLRGYHFKLEVGTYTGYFHRCYGLRVRVNHIAYREGGAGSHVRRLAGPVEPGEVTLCYGLIVNLQENLWKWLEGAMSGAPERRNPSIIVLDHLGAEKIRYNLFDAFPVNWSGPDLDALGKHVACEELTLVFERIERSV